MINTSTLRPGLLVSLKTSVRGNASYSRKDIEREKTTKDGHATAKWETEKRVADKKEYDAAYALRVECRKQIAKPCASSAFGLLCPEDNADELEAAIKEARRLTDEFNATAKLTRVSVYVMTGRVAQDDVEAVRAINSEVADLLSAMETGLKNLDAKVVREAASKVKQIGPMLSADAEAKVQIAIEAARQSAKAIAKAGEQASMEIDTLTIKKIAKQRTAFLDLSEAKEVETPKQKRRTVDFVPAEK